MCVASARGSIYLDASPTYLFDGGRARPYGDFSAAVLDATVRELLRGGSPGCSHC